MFMKDNEFQIPKIQWKFHIKSPSIRPDNPKSICLSELYVKTLTKHLNELTYTASTAGISFHVGATPTGLFFILFQILFLFF